jgi:bifunctional DNA-binding transcriptional regulator/antitoxin component of YhaV-PrlF toxin-antitoxin module
MTMQTRLSAKGQVVLPKATRVSKGWVSGLQLDVIDFPGGVFLKAHPAASSRSGADEVFDRLREIAARCPRLDISDEEALDVSIEDAVRRDESTKSG